MPSISDTALATTQARGLLAPDSPVVALVSGGADSVALLRLLAAGDLGATGGPRMVLHVNHMLRGADADADADFVTELAASLGVPVTVVRFDVGEYAAEHALNLEDAGRRIRYRFADEVLDALCQDAGVPRDSGRILVAHTRDDRIETFFMRAITGAGARGLASIPYRRERIVRPLLDCDRSSIRAYLTDVRQPWREDATNDDTSRLRARVRADLMPLAESVNPAFRDTLARTLDLLGDDDRLLGEMADAFARDFAEVDADGRVLFARDLMLTLDRGMARRTMRSAIQTAFPEASRLEAAHIEAIVDGLGDVAFARDLPEGLRAHSEYGKLVVSQSGEAPRTVTPSLLPIPGCADLGLAGRITAEAVPPTQIADGGDAVTIDGDGIRTLVVDGVHSGDRMQPLGMSGTRKLSDILVDAKVPARVRLATPVVRDGDAVVWLAGVRMSEGYRVHPGTTKAVRLSWERE